MQLDSCPSRCWLLDMPRGCFFCWWCGVRFTVEMSGFRLLNDSSYAAGALGRPSAQATACENSRLSPAVPWTLLQLIMQHLVQPRMVLTSGALSRW